MNGYANGAGGAQVMSAGRIQQPHPRGTTVSSVLHSEDNFTSSQPPKINLSLVEPRKSDAEAPTSNGEQEGAPQPSTNGALNGSHSGPSHGTNGAPNSQLAAAHLSSGVGAHPSPSLTPAFPPYGFFDALGLHAPSPMLMMPYTPTPGPNANSPFIVPATPAPYPYDPLLATPAATAAGTSSATQPGPEASPMTMGAYRHMFQHQTSGGPPPLDAFQLPPTALSSADYPPDVPRNALRYPHHPATGWRMSAASPALPPPTPTPGFPDPHMAQVHSSFARMSLSNYPASPQIQPHNRRQPLNGAAVPGANGDPNGSPHHHSAGANGVALGSPEQSQRSPPGVNGVGPGGDSEWITGSRRDGRPPKGPYGRAPHQSPPNDYGMRSPPYMYQQNPPRGVPPMGRMPPSHGGPMPGGRPQMNGAGPHMNGMGRGGRRGPHGGGPNQGYPPRGPNMPPGAENGFGPPPHMVGPHGGPNGVMPGANEYQVDNLADLPPEQVSKYATTQYGSRALQGWVMQNDENFRVVFDAIFQPFAALMTDLFGNYLCQKVLLKCNSQQLTRILERLQEEIPKVSCDRQGTRVMQRIIQHAEEESQIDMIISAIHGEGQVKHLMMDSHGCYVINAMIEFMPIEKVVFIFDVAVANCELFASDQHGLCVLKKCLQRTAGKQASNKGNSNARGNNANNGNEFSPPIRNPRPATEHDKKVMQEQYDRLSAEVLSHALAFVDNQFGNYLVQCLLDIATEKVRDNMHKIFRSRYCEFSMKKFSSNVVERFLKSGSQQIREEIVDELIRSPNFSTLLQDGFGNYVIQNSLVTAPPHQAQQLMDIIEPLLPTLRRNVRRKWERLIKSVKSRQMKKQRETVTSAATARARAVVNGAAAAAASAAAVSAAPSAAAAVDAPAAAVGGAVAAAVAEASAKPQAAPVAAEASKVVAAKPNGVKPTTPTAPKSAKAPATAVNKDVAAAVAAKKSDGGPAAVPVE